MNTIFYIDAAVSEMHFILNLILFKEIIFYISRTKFKLGIFINKTKSDSEQKYTFLMKSKCGENQLLLPFLLQILY